MAVYTDSIHLVADTEEELHAFAERVGLGRHWWEGVQKGHPHYDIPAKRWKAVMRGGAVIVTSREMVIRAQCMIMRDGRPGKEYEARKSRRR